MRVRAGLTCTTWLSQIERLHGALADFNARLVATGRAPVAFHAHPKLPDVVVVPSAPPRAEVLAGPPDGMMQVRLLWRGGGPLIEAHPTLRACWMRQQVVVYRKCGEAVLRGSDVFARGVRGIHAGVVQGCKACVCDARCRMMHPLIALAMHSLLCLSAGHLCRLGGKGV